MEPPYTTLEWQLGEDASVYVRTRIPSDDYPGEDRTVVIHDAATRGMIVVYKHSISELIDVLTEAASR
jgi:hypothetical protein